MRFITFQRHKLLVCFHLIIWFEVMFESSFHISQQQMMIKSIEVNFLFRLNTTNYSHNCRWQKSYISLFYHKIVILTTTVILCDSHEDFLFLNKPKSVLVTVIDVHYDFKVTLLGFLCLTFKISRQISELWESSNSVFVVYAWEYTERDKSKNWVEHFK